MSIQKGIIPTAAATLLLAPLSSLAHHQLDRVYERDSSILLTGTVMRVDWVNPHATFTIGVSDPSGSTVEWIVELDPPHYLQRRGWTRDAILAGQTVTVEGFRSIDGGLRTYAKSVRFPNGDTLPASSDGSWMWRLAGVDVIVPTSR